MGILGTAGIARKNWRAIHDSGNAVVSAVASREEGRSRKFIEECQAKNKFETTPVALGSYEELISSRAVDAVYVPLPTGLRKEWVLRAAAAGKHVLCEKPCGLSTADLRDMIAACDKAGVQFMDGVMFMHNPRLARMREVLDDGASVGAIRRMMSVFSFATEESFFDANIRVNGELEPAGCLGDLGWYCIRFGLWAMKWRMPIEVTGRILSARGNRLTAKSVPTAFSGEMFFEDGASMGFYCSFVAAIQNWAHVGGAKGYLRVARFVHADSQHEPTFEVNDAVHHVRHCDCPGAHDASMTTAQDTLMFRNFANQIASGKRNEEWPMWALKTQQVMDGCLNSAVEGGRTVKV